MIRRRHPCRPSRRALLMTAAAALALALLMPAGPAPAAPPAQPATLHAGA